MSLWLRRTDYTNDFKTKFETCRQSWAVRFFWLASRKPETCFLYGCYTKSKAPPKVRVLYKQYALKIKAPPNTRLSRNQGSLKCKAPQIQGFPDIKAALNTRHPPNASFSNRLSEHCPSEGYSVESVACSKLRFIQKGGWVIMLTMQFALLGKTVSHCSKNACSCLGLSAAVLLVSVWQASLLV